jgi:hypothetical protein
MWSGGKDSALALMRARARGVDVSRLLNFYDPATDRVRFHATRADVIRAQADAIGIDLTQLAVPWERYEAIFRDMLADLKREGFTGVVFGDIHLADVRAWYEERVLAAGLAHVEPIWGEPPAALVAEFVGGGSRGSMNRGSAGSSTSGSSPRSARRASIPRARTASTTRSPSRDPCSGRRCGGEPAGVARTVTSSSWTSSSRPSSAPGRKTGNVGKPWRRHLVVAGRARTVATCRRPLWRSSPWVSTTRTWRSASNSLSRWRRSTAPTSSSC